MNQPNPQKIWFRKKVIRAVVWKTEPILHPTVIIHHFPPLAGSPSPSCQEGPRHLQDEPGRFITFLNILIFVARQVRQWSTSVIRGRRTAQFLQEKKRFQGWWFDRLIRRSLVSLYNLFTCKSAQGFGILNRFLLQHFNSPLRLPIKTNTGDAGVEFVWKLAGGWQSPDSRV